MRALLEQAFEAGRAAGNQETLRAILAAAQAPIVGSQVRVHDLVPRSESESGSRARRGSVRKAIAEILAAHPGLTTAEIEGRAARMDTAISPRSVGGELRRQRNKLYRQDGARWFLAERGSAPTGTAGAELLS
jgi:hypothetical protein